jgi:hypothetical protein
VTVWVECQEPGCDAPAQTVDTYSMPGFRGDTRIVVWFDKRWCAAGHWNSVEIYEEEADD